MKDKYLDKRGMDSLMQLRIASKHGCDVFLTLCDDMIKDREELERKFNIKIRTPEELIEENKNG
jgi:hypothetical protein